MLHKGQHLDMASFTTNQSELVHDCYCPPAPLKSLDALALCKSDHY